MNHKPTLLYVDDEPINLRLFALNFKSGFEVITAESGEKALFVLQANPGVKAVISDMKMPGMNGIEFIRTAKNNFPKISYFILTGFDITEEIADALKEGLIYKYFRKPFNPKEMEVSIINALTHNSHDIAL